MAAGLYLKTRKNELWQYLSVSHQTLAPSSSMHMGMLGPFGQLPLTGCHGGQQKWLPGLSQRRRKMKFGNIYSFTKLCEEWSVRIVKLIEYVESTRPSQTPCWTTKMAAVDSTKDKKKKNEICQSSSVSHQTLGGMKFYDSENHWNNFDDQVPPGLHVGSKMAAMASISNTRKLWGGRHPFRVLGSDILFLNLRELGCL